MDNFDFSIIRELRHREKLSIAELATRSGVSAAVISRLERNQSCAELDTILRLARVFSLGASDLLALAELHTTRSSSETIHKSDDFTFREVIFRNVRCLMGQAPAGSKVSRPHIHKDDFELCWVLAGHIKVELPNEIHELKAGNSIQFDALLSHTYEAIEDSTFLVLHLKKEKRF